MNRLTSARGSARRVVALTLFALIVLAYGALAVLFANAVPVDSTIVSSLPPDRVSVDGRSAKTDRPRTRSAGGADDRR